MSACSLVYVIKISIGYKCNLFQLNITGTLETIVENVQRWIFRPLD